MYVALFLSSFLKCYVDTLIEALTVIQVTSETLLTIKLNWERMRIHIGCVCPWCLFLAYANIESNFRLVLPWPHFGIHFFFLCPKWQERDKMAEEKLRCLLVVQWTEIFHWILSNFLEMVFIHYGKLNLGTHWTAVVDAWFLVLSFVHLFGWWMTSIKYMFVYEEVNSKEEVWMLGGWDTFIRRELLVARCSCCCLLVRLLLTQEPQEQWA